MPANGSAEEFGAQLRDELVDVGDVDCVPDGVATAVLTGDVADDDASIFKLGEVTAEAARREAGAFLDLALVAVGVVHEVANDFAVLR